MTPPSLPLPLLRQIDRVCISFECGWQEQAPPALEGLLPQVPPEAQQELFLHLVKIEREYRERRGDPLTAEEVLRRFGSLAPWVKDVVTDLELDTAAARNKETGADDAPGEPDVPRPADYQQVERLAEGGMGTVYRAFDPGLRRHVALKCVSPHCVSRSTMGRFVREGQAVARLSHPHIVQVFGWSEYAGQPALVLEFVGGGTLAQALARRRLAPPEAAHVIAVIAWAVQHAHERGVVHRDLKPANVLLAEAVPGSGGNTPVGFPKVTDFGLAKHAEADTSTQEGDLLGTVGYMAPEQADGNNEGVGPAADVWGLGVMFYQMLSGRLPFEGPSALQTLRLIVEDAPPPLQSLMPDLPEDLAKLTHRCLNKSPEDRPTAGELARRLEQFLGSEVFPQGPAEQATTAATASSRPRPGQGRPRIPGPWLAVGSTLAALVVLLAGVVIGVQWDKDSQNVPIKVEPTPTDKEQPPAGPREPGPQPRVTLNGASTACWSADGKSIITGCQVDANSEKGSERVYSTDGKQLHRYEDEFPVVATIACSPNGRWFARGSHAYPDTECQLWLCSTDLKTRHRLPGPRGRTNVVLFSPDSKLLASGGADLKVRLWDVETRKLAVTLDWHEAGVRALAFDPNGKRLVSGGRDRVIVWDLKSGEIVWDKPLGEGLWSLAYSPDGKTIAVGIAEAPRVHLLDAATGKTLGALLQPLEFKDSTTTCVCFTSSGRYLLCAGTAGAKTPPGHATAAVHLWDVELLARVDSFGTGEKGVYHLALSPDGKQVMTSFSDPPRSKVWDLPEKATRPAQERKKPKNQSGGQVFFRGALVPQGHGQGE